MGAEDAYKTIAEASNETLIKEKGSKFFGYVFPVCTEQEVKLFLSTVKKQHPAARHCCYAWRLGVEKVRYRVNDDGEPNNSAGQPIYGQILSCDLTNVLIVVVRYFGGVKLGVGGLVKAYKESAQLSLQNALIVQKYLEQTICLEFDYEYMSIVLRLLKQRKLAISEQILLEYCALKISVKNSEYNSVKKDLQTVPFLKVV
jgi:uncharacterized YigZ family protein